MATARVKWIEENTFLGIDVNGKAALMSGGDGPGVSPICRCCCWVWGLLHGRYCQYS
ncbi:MAG: hypothetical protein R2932_23630 [Caldilineaceae bacterium]